MIASQQYVKRKEKAMIAFSIYNHLLIHYYL